MPFGSDRDRISLIAGMGWTHGQTDRPISIDKVEESTRLVLNLTTISERAGRGMDSIRKGQRGFSTTVYIVSITVDDREPHHAYSKRWKVNLSRYSHGI